MLPSLHTALSRYLTNRASHRILRKNRFSHSYGSQTLLMSLLLTLTQLLCWMDGGKIIVSG